MKQSQPKTIFLDIDGTILKHNTTISNIMLQNVEATILVREKIDTWLSKSYYIVITTARPDSMREVTERQLASVGIAYHRLIMGLPCGQRILINDYKPNDSTPTAVAYTVNRDSGFMSLTDDI